MISASFNHEDKIMTTAFPAGPYTLGGSEPVVIEGVEHMPANIMRTNEGQLAIMAPDTHPDAYEGERKRLGLVDLQDHKPKRGEGWKTKPEDDPRQMAIARLWMAAPEMVAALEKLVAVARSPAYLIGAAQALEDAADEADAALRKARGE